MKKTSTIFDVAALAGVAQSTVSRLLNGGYVNADKRDRIQAAVSALGYAPSWTARNLALGRRGTIGLVVRSNAGEWKSGFVAGVLDELEVHDASLLQATVGRKPGDWLRVQRLISGDRTDGLILAGTSRNTAVVAAAAGRMLPILTVSPHKLATLSMPGPIALAARESGRVACRCLLDMITPAQTKKQPVAYRKRSVIAFTSQPARVPRVRACAILPESTDPHLPL